MLSVPPRFAVGGLVEIRPLSEILVTLDANGTLGGLPFMEEMREYCGRSFRLSKRLFKTCVEGAAMRHFPQDDVVVLEDLRCSGTAHDGCNKLCLLLWKEAWLRNPGNGSFEGAAPISSEAGCSLAPCHRDGKYFCQSTELRAATEPLGLLQKLQARFQDWRAGNCTGTQLACSLLRPALSKVLARLRVSARPSGRQASTPSQTLDLKPGDWVEVKSPSEISATLDSKGRNRGLEFTGYMTPFCGRRYRVRNRVENMILETTGEMRQVKNTVALEDCICDGHLCLGACHRQQYHFWREIWLRRVPDRGCVAETSRSTLAKAGGSD